MRVSGWEGPVCFVVSKALPPFNSSFYWNRPSGGFGRLVLGETWIRHHGDHGRQSTLGIVNPPEASNAILTGIPAGAIWSTTDVYETRLPLPGDSRVLLWGQVLCGMNPADPPVAGPVNHPMMPIAWVKTYTGASEKPARVFTTTLGTSQDLLTESNRRLLVNAVYWSLGWEKLITPNSPVPLIAPYHPSPFGFGGYVKGIKPSDLAP